MCLQRVVGIARRELCGTEAGVDFDYTDLAVHNRETDTPLFDRKLHSTIEATDPAIRMWLGY